MVSQDITLLKELLVKMKKNEAIGSFERIENLETKFTGNLTSQRGIAFVIKNGGKIKKVFEIKNSSLGDDLEDALTVG